VAEPAIRRPVDYHSAKKVELMKNGGEKTQSGSCVILGLGCMAWVLLCLGCQIAKPTLTYQPLQENTFQSRTQPASLSQKSAETLLQEGFVKVGYLSLNVLEKICRHYFVGGQDIHDRCTSVPDSDPLPWLLQKGQAVGGDLVVIEFENPYTEIMNMMARDGYYRKEFSAITAAVWRKDG
jgi:hypothetical protein